MLLSVSRSGLTSTISNERTFVETSKATTESQLCGLCERVCSRARSRGGSAHRPARCARDRPHDGRGHGRRVVGAHGDRRREELLDRDLALQRRVPAQIEDAEGALADQPRDLVVAQTRAERQRVPGVRLRRRARLLEIGGRGHLVNVLQSRRRVGRGSRRSWFLDRARGF